MEAVDYNPAEQEQIEERLDQLYRLSRKYGETEEEMLAFLESARAERDGIQRSEQRLARLEEELDAAKLQLQQKGARLTESRREAGMGLDAAVCRELAFLNMPDVQFITHIEPAVYTAAGADKVEFFISTNPGEPPNPCLKLHRAANFPVSCWRSKAFWPAMIGWEPSFLMKSIRVSAAARRRRLGLNSKRFPGAGR